MEIRPVLVRRFGKTLHFGLLVQGERDTKHARIKELYVTWDAIREFLNH